MNLPDLDNLRIRHYPDPVLKRVAAPVDEFSHRLRALADKMLALMRQSEGVGLAAPQVGVPIRMFVCNPTGEAGHDLICVNPQFTELTGAEEKEEGCLSVPGVNVAMRRAARVVMEAFDTDGKPFQKAAEDLVARIWQHEMDHLDGRLICDNMSATDEIANRRAVKQLVTDYAARRKVSA